MAWPRSAGKSDDVVVTIADSFEDALRGADDKGRGLLARIAAEYQIAAGKELLVLVAAAEASDDTRLAALRALRALKADEFEAGLQSAYQSGRSKLRAAASDLLSSLDPERALRIMDEALRSGSLRERQQAYRTLGRMTHERADAHLLRGLDDLLAGTLEAAVQLDVVTAARERAKRKGGEALVTKLQAMDARFPAGPDPLPSRLLTLEGGDAELGRKIFRDKTEVSCRRCHAVGAEGATDRGALAGPNLAGVGTRYDRMYLLRSLLQPSADLSPGYAEIMVETKEQDVYRGRVVSETETELVLDTVEVGQIERVTVKKSLIIHRQTEKSSMPEDVAEKLNLSELRDLVEYLASLRDA
jgi:quinoprotein glucose dehydrogenase